MTKDFYAPEQIGKSLVYPNHNLPHKTRYDILYFIIRTYFNPVYLVSQILSSLSSQSCSWMILLVGGLKST